MMVRSVDVDFMNIDFLVGGLEHDFDFSIQLGIIIPTDALIFFRGVGSATKQIFVFYRMYENMRYTFNFLGIYSTEM